MKIDLKKQVIIDVSIIAVNLNENHSSGINWQNFNLDFASTTQNGQNSFIQLQSGQGVVKNLGLRANINFNSVLNFLSQNGKNFTFFLYDLGFILMEVQMNKTKFFRLSHIYVSLFFLPVALLYSISGVAYIFGIKDDVFATKMQYEVNATLIKGQEEQMLLQILNEQNIKIPSNTKLRNDRKQGGLSLGGIHYSINAKQQDPQTLIIKTTTRSLLGDMILLHKDKGGWYFSVLGVGFGIALAFLYLSGLMITLFASKKDRNPQLIVLALGVLTCLVLGYLSV